jgi:hypothetical protein
MIVNKMEEQVKTSWYKVARGAGVSERDCELISGAFAYPVRPLRLREILFAPMPWPTSVTLILISTQLERKGYVSFEMKQRSDLIEISDFDVFHLLLISLSIPADQYRLWR